MSTLRRTACFAAGAVCAVVMALLVTLGSAAAAGAGAITYSHVLPDMQRDAAVAM